MNLDPYFTPYAEINSKRIKSLNIRPKTVKLLEENIGHLILDIDLGNDFYGSDTNKHIQQIENKQVGLYQSLASDRQKKPLAIYFALKINEAYIHKTHKTIENKEAVVNRCRVLALAVAITPGPSTDGEVKNVHFPVFP